MLMISNKISRLVQKLFHSYISMNQKYLQINYFQFAENHSDRPVDRKKAEIIIANVSNLI